MQRCGRLLEDRASLRVDMRLTTRTREASTIFVLRELPDLSAFVALRRWKLLIEEIEKTGGIVWELFLELFDGDEMQFHG